MADKTAKKTTAPKASKSTTSKKVEKSASSARKTAAKTKVRMTRTLARANQATAKPKSEGSRIKVKALGHAPHSARITEAKGPVTRQAGKTLFAPKENEDRKWLLVDVAGQTVGRVASEIAKLLRGKHKATFTPNNDVGDFVVVINCEKVKFTAAKEEQKQYFKHSGWIGGMKVTTPQRLRKEHPERILENAVRGMISRSPLGRDQMRKLKIYAGTEHPHVAQAPMAWKLRSTPNSQE